MIMVRTAVSEAEEEQYRSGEIASAVRIAQSTPLRLEEILTETIEGLVADVAVNETKTATPTLFVDADNNIVYSFSSNPPIKYNLHSATCAYGQYRKSYEPGESTSPEAAQEKQETAIEKKATDAVLMVWLAHQHGRTPIADSESLEDRDALRMLNALDHGWKHVLYDLLPKML